MILRWWKRRRRKKLLRRPFPAAWRDILAQRMKYVAWLTPEERERMERLVAVFVAEKHWEGCGGLALTDDVRVTIAGQACLLILNLHHDYYRNVKSILVYPSTVMTPADEARQAETGTGVSRHAMPILGQAMLGGPVLLVWDAVREGGFHPQRGHNVVYHEFAHKLDMLDGAIDGIPPMFDRATYTKWSQVVEDSFNDLQRRQQRGARTILNAYAGTSVPEFFAVATEYFFERPRRLRRARPELYEVLSEFYRQDPAERMRDD